MQALTRIYVVNSALVQANEQNGDFGETWLNDHDAGSGPYVLTSFEPEQQFTIEAFPEYWKGWDGNHVDRAIFRVIKEESARRLALENAEVDWAMIGSVETFNALVDNPDLQTFSDPTLNQLYFAFNQENEYLRDPKVREALSLVYDYNGHVEQARGGQAEVARGPFPQQFPFFDEAMQPSTMDIEAARAALAESAYPEGGFSLEMIYQGTSPEETTAVQIMQAGAAELNIQIVPVAMEWPAKVDTFSSPETAMPMATIWIFPGYPDPEQYFYPLLDSANIGNGGVNFSHFSTPETDDLIEQAAQETDEAARAELYKELQEWWVTNRPYMDIVVGYALSASRTWLQGYQWSPTHSFTQNVYPDVVGRQGRLGVVMAAMPPRHVRLRCFSRECRRRRHGRRSARRGVQPGVTLSDVRHDQVHHSAVVARHPGAARGHPHHLHADLRPARRSRTQRRRPIRHPGAGGGGAHPAGTRSALPRAVPRLPRAAGAR